jgi:hypothetical protein
VLRCDPTVTLSTVRLTTVIHWLSSALQQVMAASGGFKQLDPAWQALLQAAAERLVLAGADATSMPVLRTIQSVPLMSGNSYTRVLTELACLPGGNSS